MPSETSSDGTGRFVDDREESLDDHTTLPEAFDKLGDPDFGRDSPGRCHVCLAWVRYPYSERTLTVCPDCHDRSEVERARVRDRVREALRDVWSGD